MSDVSLGNATGYVALDTSQVVSGANQARDAFSSLAAGGLQTFYSLQVIGQGIQQLGDGLQGLALNVITTAEDIQSKTAQLTEAQYNFTQSTDANIAAGNAQTGQLINQANALDQPIGKFITLGTTVTQFGYRGEDVKKVTSAVSELAQVTGTNATQMATPFARLLDQFHLTADQAQPAAAAIYEVSQHVVGGAQAMTVMTTRAAELAQSLGLNFQQTIGLTGILTDLDGRTRGAAQTFGNFGVIMVNELSKGGKAGTALADAMGTTAADLKQRFATSAVGTIGDVLNRIDELRQGGTNVVPILNEMGVKGAQSVQGILALASSAHGMATEGKSLGDMIGYANDGMANGQHLTDAYSVYQKTAQAATVDFKNALVQLKDRFAVDLLPIISTFLRTGADVLRFFTETPAGIASAITALALIGGTFLIVAAGAIRLGSQLLILARSWTQMQLASIQAGQATQESAAVVAAADEEIVLAQTEMNAAIARSEGAIAGLALGTEQLQLAFGQTAVSAEQLSFNLEGLGATEQAVTAKTEQLAVAEETVSTSGNGLMAGMGGLGGIFGGVMIIVTAFTTALQIHSAALQKVKQDTEAWKKSEEQKSGSGTLDQIKTQASDAQTELDKLTTKLAHLEHDISFGGFVHSITDPAGAIKGDPHGDKERIQQQQAALDSYNRVIDNATKLAAQFGLTAEQAYERAKKAGIDLAGNAGDVAQKFGDLMKQPASGGGVAIPDTSDNDKAYQAAEKLGKANISLTQSYDAVAAAQIAYRDAMRNAADQAEKVAEAQLKIREANLKVRESQLALLQAQETARFAAQDQAFALQDAQNGVVDAQLRMVDGQDRIIKAQTALEKLNSRDYYLQLQQAINSVADEQLRLQDETTKAGDAQWYLNYLLQEGASARDIQDARLALAQANQKVTDTTTNLQVAQDKVSDMPTQHALDLAAAQQTLDRAQLDASRSAESLAKAEEALQKQQFITANNIDVIKAQDALATAEYGVQNAIFAVHNAMQALQKLMDGSAERQLEMAKHALTAALYAEAEAQHQIAVDTAIANGHALNARESAKDLADKLIAVGQAAGNMQLVQAGNSILQHLVAPADTATRALDDLNAAIQRNIDSFNAYVRAYGAAAGAGSYGQPGNPGFMGGNLFAHNAVGGIINTPIISWLAESGPEVVLPLNDINRTMDLLQASGLMSSVSDYMSSQTGGLAISPASYSTTNNTRGGNQFNLTAITSADPKDIVDQFFWGERVSSRS